MGDKPKKTVKPNIKREVAVLRDEVAFLKKRFDLLFTTCDEGLVRAYTREKDPIALLDSSLKQVARLKVTLRTVLESFKPGADA